MDPGIDETRASAEPTTPPKLSVVATDLHASYGQGALRVPVLEGASFSVPRGAVVAITGPSGSGKTTLLSLIGALDVPDSGRLEVNGEVLTDKGRRGLNRFRREQVGFVFQSFNLLPTLTVRENVESGLEPLNLGRTEIAARAKAELEAVGLADKLGRFPSELSGGEQQRVAVARACVKRPPLLLGDEPTGNLDEDAGAAVLDLLLAETSCERNPCTVILVTHDPAVAERADTVLSLHGHHIEVVRAP